jgi:hypothetical protein
VRWCVFWGVGVLLGYGCFLVSWGILRASGALFRPFRAGSAWRVGSPGGKAFAFPIGQAGLSGVGSPASREFFPDGCVGFPKGVLFAGSPWRAGSSGERVFVFPGRRAGLSGVESPASHGGFPSCLDATPSNMRLQLTACGHLLEHDLRNYQTLREQNVAYHGGN